MTKKQKRSELKADIAEMFAAMSARASDFARRHAARLEDRLSYGERSDLPAATRTLEAAATRPAGYHTQGMMCVEQILRTLDRRIEGEPEEFRFVRHFVKSLSADADEVQALRVEAARMDLEDGVRETFMTAMTPDWYHELAVEISGVNA